MTGATMAERLAAEIEREPRFGQYPTPAPVPFAVEVALEMVEEWNYRDDPHGWCHTRPVLLGLLDALVSRGGDR